MAKKIKHIAGAAILTLALTVPANTLADAVVPLGTAGLKGYTLTPRATTATIADGTAAVGLKDGEASVSLIGVQLIPELDLDGAIAQYAKVYVTAAGVYTATVGANVFVGYALAALAGAGKVKVALVAA